MRPQRARAASISAEESSRRVGVGEGARADVDSSPSRVAACAQAHSRVMLGLMSFARSVARLLKLVEEEEEEEAVETQVEAESTLIVRVSTG